MSPRAATRLGWGLAAVTGFGLVAAVILGLLSGPDARPSEVGAVYDTFVAGAAAAIFATIGALIVARYPRNAVGWIVCVIPLGMALALFSAEYAVYAVLAEPGSLPGGEVMAWLSEWIWLPTMLVGNFLLLLFPGGRLPSPRWRLVAWLAGAGMIGVGLHEAFSPGGLDDFPRTNPYALGGTGGDVAEALAISYLPVTITVLASVASLVIRLRRSEGHERQQLKWLASGGVVLFLGTNLPGDLPLFIGLAAVAGAVGIGILKYRLYDIDVVINRALVYTALTALLIGTYLGSILLLQLVLSGLTADNGLAIAGSTLAVAALFQPARARIQAAVDRRFYRLRAVVGDTMQPAHVSLWLREGLR